MNYHNGYILFFYSEFFKLFQVVLYEDKNKVETKNY